MSERDILPPVAIWSYNPDDHLRGLDIHGGLRIRFEHNGHVLPYVLAKNRSDVLASYSAETGVNPDKDVEDWLRTVRLKVQMAQAWLLTYRAQRRATSEGT